MADSVKSLADVEADNIHCPPLIYLAGHAIIEGYQISWAWFAFGESMLTTPDNLLFLHLLRDDSQNKLFHHLSRDLIFSILFFLEAHCSSMQVSRIKLDWKKHGR